jgi:hypothetical protein
MSESDGVGSPPGWLWINKGTRVTALIGQNISSRLQSGVAMSIDSDSDTSMNALTLVKECYAMKLDLISSATVVDRAIRFENHTAIGLKIAKY